MERTIVSLIFSAIFSLPWTLAMAQGEADPFAAEPAPATGSATPATQAKPVPAADAPEADAKPAAPAKPAEFPNLVPNAGLKEPGDDKLPKLWRFSRWHGGEDVDHALAAEGRKPGSLCFRLGCDDPTDCGFISQEITIKPNTRYRYGGWIRTENIKTESVQAKGATILVAGTPTTLETERHYTDPVTGTTEWKFVRGTFESGNTTTIMLAAVLGGNGNASGTAWFEGLFVREQGAPTETPAKPEPEPDVYRRPLLDNPVVNREGLTLDKDQVDALAEAIAQLVVNFAANEVISSNDFRAKALGIALHLDPKNPTAVVANGRLDSGQPLRAPDNDKDLQSSWASLDRWVELLHGEDMTADDTILGLYLGDLTRRILPDKGFSTEYVKLHTANNLPDWSRVVPPPPAPVIVPPTPMPADPEIAANPDTSTGEKPVPPPVTPEVPATDDPAQKFRLGSKLAKDTASILTAVQTGSSESRAASRKVTLSWRDWEYKDQHQDGVTVKRKVPLANKGNTDVLFNPEWHGMRDRWNKLTTTIFAKRFDGWPQRGAIDVGIPSYQSTSGSTALLATAICFESMARGLTISPGIAVVGTWSDDGKFIGHSHTPGIVLGYGKDWSELLVVGPLGKESKDALDKLARVGLMSPFLNTQIIEVDTYTEALAIATGNCPADLQRAIDAFKAVQSVRVRMDPSAMAQNRFVLDKVREVATMSPKHLSSALILTSSANQQAMDFATSMQVVSRLYQGLEQMAEGDLEWVTTEEGLDAIAIFKDRLRELKPRMDRGVERLNIKIDDALRSLEETVRVRDRTTSTAEKRIENTRDKVRETRQAIDLATAAGR